MHPQVTCAQLAARNHGIFDRAEALAAGITTRALRRLVVAGELEELFPGVYKFAGSPATWHQTLLAAVRWAGPLAAASHRSAAALWQLPTFAEPDIEIVTTREVRSDIVTVHFVPRLHRWDLRTQEGIPVTTIERTLLDLSAVCSARRLDVALDDVLRRRMTTTDRLARILDLNGGRGRNGAGALRKALAERAGSRELLESGLERRTHALIASSGLPEPVPQYRLQIRGRNLRVDFAYPDARLAVEVLGYEPHVERSRWEHDQKRQSLLATVGWRVIYITKRRLEEEPVEVIDEIKIALATPLGALPS